MRLAFNSRYEIWCADFKGWFLTANGQRCDPLTVTDAYSRYLLRCRAVPKTDGPHVREVFTAAFREFGLPQAIRTDNGPPFASTGLAGLSRLAVWWIRLGIRPDRIEPGCPEQNGRHERFHLTLKAETASPPRANLNRQQQRFAEFQDEYNHIRPHEALGMRTPDRFYRASPRKFPAMSPALRLLPSRLLPEQLKTGALPLRPGDLTLDARVFPGYSRIAGRRVGPCRDATRAPLQRRSRCGVLRHP